MKINQEIVKDDITIFSDASPKSSDSIYNEINAPHYRDFLNDVTFGEGDSWFDKQNNTTILSFLEKKFDVLTLANDSKLSTDLKDDIDIAYKQETVSKESNIQKHLDPPQRVRNYPTLRSLGIQKRQPMKKFIPELTVPKPFKFHTITRINKTERTESQLLKSPYIPLAARIKQFMERTPDRFKSNLVSIKPTAIQVNLPTKPKSPILRTKLRAKSRKVLETEKKKTKENHIIHKKSVNLKRFEFGVPRIKKADITIPRSPPITKPKPPVRKSPSPPHIIKVNPIPDFKEPFRPIIPRRKLKMPKFSLPGDEISHRKAKEKEEKIRRETLEQEKARLFKAQPLPSDSPDPLPPVKTAPATKSRPFKLETNARGEKYQQRLRQELVKMKRRDKENHRFHAKPAPKPKFPLTQTKKQSKPLTEPVGRNWTRKKFDLRIT